MNLTDRQKNIVNPYAENFNSDERRGVGYDYQSSVNRFVLDAIHESFIYFYEFPQIGTVITGIERENNTITIEDMLAYFALYPQNGKVINNEPVQINFSESVNILNLIVNLLSENGSLRRYSTITTELTYQEEYQDNRSNVLELDQQLANLIAIIPTHSLEYRNKLRRSIGLNEIDYNDEPSLDLLDIDPEIAIYVSSDSNLDLYDWRNNALPGEDNDRVYYNPADKKYYYVKRTNNTTEEGYLFNRLRAVAKTERVGSAIAIWSRYSTEKKNLYTTSVEKGIREILKLTARNTEDNFSKLRDILVPPESFRGDKKERGAECFPLLTYKDDRPGSRWVYAIKIDATLVSLLETSSTEDNDLRPSQNEYQRSSLELSRFLINPSQNKTLTSIAFKNSDMIRYLLPVRALLRDYDQDLHSQGITPEFISGIDLRKEAERLESFFDLLELFYSYNKISLKEEDYVEFFFTKNYQIDHIAINGTLYYQGCGVNPYLNLVENSTATVNAFSIYTPTTFSIIRNVFEIYNQTNIQSRKYKTNVLEFMETYIFPKQNINALKTISQNNRTQSNKINKRRSNLFSKLSELSSLSPSEYEVLFDKRYSKYRISSILSSIDCDTGQATTAKYALKFYQAANSKTRWRSLIREAIILLRQEVIDDQYTFLGITSADEILAYASRLNDQGLIERLSGISEAERRNIAIVEEQMRNGDITFEEYDQRLAQIRATASSQRREPLIRAAEQYINSQINCSLDILGDYIEDNFLGPLDEVPLVKDLTRKSLESIPTIEFKKGKMISFKARQSVVYRKLIETIILNFVKSLTAGVAKDILNALLGCGPNSPLVSSRQGLGTALRRLNFGEVNLFDLLTEVDIVQIAKNVPLYVEQRVQVEQTTLINKSYPTLEKLSDLLIDVSKMIRPVEAQQLLDGDASSELIQHILETITGNIIITQEDIDPSRYNDINFDSQKLKDFFIQLGDALNEEVETAVENSPLSVYCETKNTQNYDSLSISNTDIQAVQEQYDEIVQNKINKINRLCDFLKGMPNLQLEIDELMSFLPNMSYYDDMLRMIASISNSIASSITSLFSKSFEQEQKQLVRSRGNYNLYGSKLGTELFYQSFFSMRFVPINQIYLEGNENDERWGFLTPTTWNTEYRTDRYRRIIELTSGARTNRYTQRHVEKFIWAERGTTVAPRVDLPQYQASPRPLDERRDIGYYSKASSPRSLQRILEQDPNLLSKNYTSGVDDEGNVETGENRLMLDISNRTIPYLKNEELEAPYIGWTGATFLECGSKRSSNNKKITISYFEPSNDFTKDYNVVVVAEYDPSGPIKNESSASPYSPGINGDFEKINYDIFNGYNLREEEEQWRGNNLYQTEDMALRVPDRQGNGIRMPMNSSTATRNLYGNFSIGVPQSRFDNRTPGRPYGRTNVWKRDEDIKCLQNYTIRNDGLINATVTSDIGKRRMPKYVLALSKPPFTITDDVCVIQEDISKGKAAIEVIQSRMIPFFINIMPLATAYPSWGSVGTIQLIVDYLHRKISKDLKSKNILGALYNSIEFISTTFPYSSEGEYRVNPRITDFNTPEQNLRAIIESMYLQILRNIQETSEYKEISLSIFNPSAVAFGRYKRSLVKYYKAILETRNMRSFGVPDFDVQRATDRLEDFFDGDEPTDLGLLVGVYYMPIAFQIASYMIYYDLGIRFTNRFSDTNYQSMLQIAASDDGLLSATRGQTVYNSVVEFEGFPVSVENWEQTREITYYNQSQVRDRISYLDQVIQNFSLALEQRRGLFGLTRLAELFSQNNQQTSVEDLYEKYFSNEPGAVRINEIFDNRIELESRPWPPHGLGPGNLREEVISGVNNWLRNWSSLDRATLTFEEQIRISALRFELIEAEALRQEQRAQRIREEITQIENQPERLTGFNYNRTLENSRARAEDPNTPAPEREGEEIWIEILENNYKNENVDIFTSPIYFNTIYEYFLTVASSVQLQFEQFLSSNELRSPRRSVIELQRQRPGNPQLPVPPELRLTANVLEEVAIFFIYLATLYRDSYDVAAKVLEEKSKLENLINNNE